MLPRGTTPTIKYTFTSIAVSDIEECILTIVQSGEILVTKDLSEAVDTGDDYISWQLSQSETLQFSTSSTLSIQIKYKLTSGEVYTSRVTSVPTYTDLYGEAL